MFFKNILYEIKLNFRAKEVLIWMIIFPICLGLFYKLAFGNLGKSMEPVSVAVVENTEDKFFHMFYDTVNNNQKDENSSSLLNATYCSEKEAYEKLYDGDVAGVVIIDPIEGESNETSSGDISSMSNIFGENWDQMKDFDEISEKAKAVSVDTPDINKYMDTLMNSYIRETNMSVKIQKNGSEQSTLKSYIEMFINMKKMAKDLWKSNSGGQKNKAVDNISDMMNAATIKSTPLTDGNKDPLAMYMYNLIAMVSIFGSLAAMHIAITNQANLSTIGMRRSCAGTPKSMVILPGLIGTYISHSFCVLISITFLKFALQIDFGDKLLLVYLTGILGAIMGVSLGFFVGAIGRLTEGAKTGIMMAVNMTLCFMSGLMIDAIRAVFSMQIPIVNALNPVAIVTDAMYYLNMDTDLSRYLTKLMMMGGFTVVFIVLGILMTRRKKYASL
ncbi:MAG: ABC transporter permease [Eubacterium sp.]|nr:ABC transporter permease [Eubacterium sp.]